MTPLSPEQVIASQQAGLAAFFELGSKLFDSVEKLAALNTQAIRSTLAEAQDKAIKAIGTADLHEWFLSRPGAVNGELAETCSSYNRHLLDIASTMQADVAQVMQTRYSQYCSGVQTLIQAATKNSPAGSEAAIAAWKSAIGAASSLYTTLQKTQQQVAEVAKGNLSTLAAPATEPRGVPPSRARNV